MRLIINNFIRLLKRHKTVAILNFTGLTLAFAILLIVVIQLKHDLGFNRSIKGHKEIYTFKSLNTSTSQNNDVETKNSRYSSTISIPKLMELADLVGVDEVGVSTGKMQGFFSSTNDANSVISNLSTCSTDKGFVNIIAPNIIQGDTSLIDKKKVGYIITESTAERLYGEAYCIGETIYTFENGKNVAQGSVVAVIEDMPSNSSFCEDVWIVNDPKTIFPFNYSSYNYHGYIKSNSKQAQLINELLSKENEREKNINEKNHTHFSIDPIAKTHLMRLPYYGYGYWTEEQQDILTIQISIGLIILIIALFNLFNLQVALIPTRLSLLCTMRALGLKKSKLRILIVSESILYAFISLILSLFVADYIGGSEYTSSFSADLHIWNHPMLIIQFMGAILLLVTIVSIYPSIYASSTPLAKILKGGYNYSNHGVRLRKVLITLQFTVSMIVLTLGLLMQSQLEYLRSQDWGFETENILYVQGNYPSQSYLDRANPLVEELKKDSRILDCSFALFLPGRINMGWSRTLANQAIYFSTWYVAHNFIDFIELEMTEGNSFEGYNQEGKAVLIANQSLWNEIEHPHPEQLEIRAFDNMGRIRGVVQDFNFSRLKNAISPLALVCSDDQKCHYILIKVSGEDMPQVIRYIHDVWKQQNLSIQHWGYLDQAIDVYYQESKTARQLLTLSIIALIIPIMGVYGFTMFTTQQRKKEIAIRKVNGASKRSLIWLLQKDYMILIGAAFIIATPIIYYIFDYWISGYAYQMTITPFNYVLALMTIIIITSITILVQSIKTIYTNPTKVLKSI